MTMVKWISIKEQLPPEGQGVLISDGEFVTAAELTLTGLSGPRLWDGHCCGGYEWEWDFDTREITHWAELPEPPFVLIEAGGVTMDEDIDRYSVEPGGVYYFIQEYINGRWEDITLGEIDQDKAEAHFDSICQGREKTDKYRLIRRLFSEEVVILQCPTSPIDARSHDDG